MSFWAAAQLESHRERLALHFLGLNGFTTYCPRIRAQRVTPTHRGEGSAWLFPGYAAPGVIRLVCSGDAEPAKVPVSVIDALRSRERNGYVVLPREQGLKRGDKVRIVHGVLNGSLAIYEGMRSGQRIEVLLTFLGAQQRITLPRKDIQAI
jgi:transcriptional antiterminator RfaH